MTSEYQGYLWKREGIMPCAYCLCLTVECIDCPTRPTHMNGKKRCKAHGHLVEFVPCAQCKEEGIPETEVYEDWFQ